MSSFLGGLIAIDWGTKGDHSKASHRRVVI